MAEQARPTWRFPRFFWSANAAELFERAAYYGVFIGLAVYLSRSYGFSDVAAGWVNAYFTGTIYLAPMFCGALADRMGFRRALALAFGLLSVGYAMLGGFGTNPARDLFGTTGIQVGAVLGLTVILVGGAFVKAVISGTVAISSDEASRARAFSIFYLVVNVGAFVGKTIAYPLRVELGLQYVSFFSALMGLCGLAVVLVFYRGVPTSGQAKSLSEIGRAFARVLRNGRFVSLILIVAGFWYIQGQMYSAMPKYVLRTVGEGAAPEWLANINPFVVMILVLPITHLVRRLRPVTSIGISLFMICVSAVMTSLSPQLAAYAGRDVDAWLVVLHPVTFTVSAGIALQGMAECFLSPRYLEFASKQAPKGEEGLYMGFSHLHTFFAWVAANISSGYLLDYYCPDPKTLGPTVEAQWRHAVETGGALPDAYANAHHMWYVFAGVGVTSFVLLLVFRFATDRADRRAGRTA